MWVMTRMQSPTSGSRAELNNTCTRAQQFLLTLHLLLLGCASSLSPNFSPFPNSEKACPCPPTYPLLENSFCENLSKQKSQMVEETVNYWFFPQVRIPSSIFLKQHSNIPLGELTLHSPHVVQRNLTSSSVSGRRHMTTPASSISNWLRDGPNQCWANDRDQPHASWTNHWRRCGLNSSWANNNWA